MPVFSFLLYRSEGVLQIQVWMGEIGFANALLFPFFVLFYYQPILSTHHFKETSPALTVLAGRIT